MQEILNRLDSIISNIEDELSGLGEIHRELEGSGIQGMNCPFVYGLEENIDCKYLKNRMCGNIIENATQHDAWCRKTIIGFLKMKIKTEEIIEAWEKLQNNS